MSAYYAIKRQSKHGLLYIPEIGEFMRILLQVVKKNAVFINIIFVPGLACAIRVTNGVWHRGLIMEVFDGRTVDVLLVDYGNKVKVSFEQIRTMPERFMSGPAQVLSSANYYFNYL